MKSSLKRAETTRLYWSRPCLILPSTATSSMRFDPVPLAKGTRKLLADIPPKGSPSKTLRDSTHLARRVLKHLKVSWILTICVVEIVLTVI